MTSAEIRQSFLDFFKSKGHTLVPSSSLMPDSPNLLFTNAGMNQFVPIFLGQRAPDVSKWAGAIPGSDTRAADTQKCIRAGGKHNDLEDVGLDTYHHTFFEMLGNWSFGDYFKKEAIEWAWELVTEVWKFPKHRLYATVYSPDKSKGDPSEFDQEAYDVWAEKFRAAGLDPEVHIVNGNKKDNFWMMGDTGPCGPCSELHVDLTPQGDTKGRLVNQPTAECIEIWNLVFIQFNANPDGTFSPLPAKHVDTGMGFERVTGILQNTKNFTDFNRVISNYETDIFRPIFDRIEKLSGKSYGSTLPRVGQEPVSPAAAAGAQALDPRLLTDLATIAAAKLARGSTDLAAWREETTEELGEAVRPYLDAAWLAGQKLLDEEIGRFEWSDLGDTVSAKADSGVGAASQETHPSLPLLPKEQERIDIAFRVIADHIRTLSFAIADGIQPGNTDRNYVLRRILRRAVRYGRPLGFREPFFYKLVSVLVDTMGHAFPELRARQHQIEQVIQREEEAFNKTLDRGIRLFENQVFANALTLAANKEGITSPWFSRDYGYLRLDAELPKELELQLMKFRTLEGKEIGAASLEELRNGAWGRFFKERPTISGDDAFVLYDTYGFPLDLTELMARERGLTVDVAGFNKLMEEQKARARAAQKKQVIELSQVETTTPTQFVGFDKLESPAKVLEVVGVKDKTAVILDTSPLYAEMGGQVGDTGEMSGAGELWTIINTQKAGDAWLHLLADKDAPAPGTEVQLSVDRPRREAIQRHHTVTHLLHWALHEVVSRDATQKGSYVGPEKLTFDFSSAPLTPQQVADVERLVNERILENAAVTWTEVGYADVKARQDVMQFFGEKYGDRVRVVQIGGKATALDGYSMELCGGTHTRATGEVGLFRIVGESAIAAGIRRIEAVSGLEAYKRASEELQLIKVLAGKVNSPVGELEKKIESLLAQQKNLEKQLKAMQQKQAAEIARGLAAKAQTFGSTPAIVENLGAADGDFLQSIAEALRGQFKGVAVLGGTANGAVALLATVAPEFTKTIQAGKIIQTIAPIVGGKGGGRPDNARGGGKDVSKLDEALAKAKRLLG
jgi:alanyl-tRNA synthetase